MLHESHKMTPKTSQGPWIQCSYGRALILCVTLALVFILYWSAPAWLWCHTVDPYSLCAAQKPLSVHGERYTLFFSNFMAGYKRRLQLSSEFSSPKRTCTSPPSVYMRRGDSEQNQSDVSCHPLMPRGAGCAPTTWDMAEDDPPEKCAISQDNICQIKENTDSSSVHDVKCDRDICEGKISLGFEIRTADDPQWRSFPGVSELEHGLLELLSPLATNSEHAGFCIIICSAKKSPLSVKHTDVIAQLLSLPLTGRHGPQNETSDTDLKRSDESININIVLLDSLSRSQFFYSLPKAVLALKETNSRSDAAVALDFELNQSLDPTVTLKDFLLEKVMQPSGGEGHGLFRVARDLNYHTLWLEELCWNSETGMLNDVDSSLHRSRTSTGKRSQLIEDAFLRAGVIDLGPSLAKCLLHDHTGAGLPTCLSDQEYLLDYLAYRHRPSARHRNPHLSVFTSRSVPAYDLDAFDESLAKQIDSFASLENTISIITSESHKTEDVPQNSYNQRLAFSNSALFIIMPRSVQTLLGHRHSNNLIQNQKRLVTAGDLRETLQTLLRRPDGSELSSSRDGLLSLISANRTCADLTAKHRPTSSMCLCRDQEMPLTKLPHDTLVAEFALGKLNDLARYQVETSIEFKRKVTKEDLKKRCPQLEASGFGNISRAYGDDGFVTTRLDLYIEPETMTTARKSSRYRYESSSKHVIRVGVRYLIDPDQTSGSLRMELMSYARTSPRPANSVCDNHRGNASDLCICDSSKNYKSSRDMFANRFWMTNQKSRAEANLTNIHDPKWQLSKPPVVFNTTPTVQSADPNGEVQCLYVAYRTHAAGNCFDVLNICDDRVYFVMFDLSAVNFTYSGEVPVSLQVAPLSRRYAMAALQTGDMSYWKYSVQFSFSYME